MMKDVNTAALSAALRTCSHLEYNCALVAELQRIASFKMLTLTLIDKQECQARRIFSTHGLSYEIGGVKPLQDNAWSQRVLGEKQPFVANTHAELAAVFADSDLIRDLGLGAVVNYPLCVNSSVIGTLNILDEVSAYTHFNPEVLNPFEPWLVVSVLSAEAMRGVAP